ncbi:hypothetical protein [Psychroflexus planctonicus]|nr:hypothetical protein [Psychroflexus planctonicus]
MLSFLNSWFRKITGNKRFNYDYNSVYFKYADFGLYEEFCAHSENYIHVQNEIHFLEDVSFTSTSKELRKTLGKPVTVVNLTNKPKTEIYLYKTIRDGEKQKLLFHFFQDKILMVSRVFPYATNTKILELQNRFLTKFNLAELDEKQDRISIQDNNKQHLFLISDVEYTEHFMKFDKQFKDFVSLKFKETSLL